ncbi:MAG TPA: response regulator [Thermoanaerobaculaceae bacterium]|nr:response regulator [Thermoanaerobaculaceae bacterium]
MTPETRKTVLIVDDEEPFLLSLVDALAPHARQLRVLTALDGQQALDLVGRFGADLVVTDLKMSGVDGFALLAALKQHHAHAGVIVMTAYNSPLIEAALVPFTPLAFFEKPIDPDELVEAILQATKPGDEPLRSTTAVQLLAIPVLLAHFLAPVCEQAFPNQQAQDSWRGPHATQSPTRGNDWRTALCSDPRV